MLPTEITKVRSKWKPLKLNKIPFFSNSGLSEKIIFPRGKGSSQILHRFYLNRNAKKNVNKLKISSFRAAARKRKDGSGVDGPERKGVGIRILPTFWLLLFSLFLDHCRSLFKLFCYLLTFKNRLCLFLFSFFFFLRIFFSSSPSISF